MRVCCMRPCVCVRHCASSLHACALFFSRRRQAAVKALEETRVKLKAEAEAKAAAAAKAASAKAKATEAARLKAKAEAEAKAAKDLDKARAKAKSVGEKRACVPPSPPTSTPPLTCLDPCWPRRGAHGHDVLRAHRSHPPPSITTPPNSSARPPHAALYRRMPTRAQHRRYDASDVVAAPLKLRSELMPYDNVPDDASRRHLLGEQYGVRHVASRQLLQSS